MPLQALALLAHRGFKLAQKVLVVAQPLAGYALAAALDPLRLVFAPKVLKVAQLAVGQIDLALKVPQSLGGCLFSFFGHFDHRRQTRCPSSARHNRLTTRCRGKQAGQVAAAFAQADVVVQTLAQVRDHGRLQSNGGVGFTVATGHVGAHADQVPRLLEA